MYFYFDYIYPMQIIYHHTKTISILSLRYLIILKSSKSTQLI